MASSSVLGGFRFSAGLQVVFLRNHINLGFGQCSRKKLSALFDAVAKSFYELSNADTTIISRGFSN